MHMQHRSLSATHHSPYHTTMYTSNNSTLDKEERKREYNRLAQREFRRRRKEHLKNLEQSQKDQSSEKLEEIERLRYQNTELRRENEALRAQIYGSPSSQQHSMSSRSLSSSTPHQQQHESRSYSLSPSATGSHSSSSAGSPSAMMGNSDMMQMPAGIGYSSSMLVPTMSQFSDHSIGMMSGQPYSMVHPHDLRQDSHSSPESSEFGKPSRYLMGPSFQPLENLKIEGESGPMWVTDYLSVY